MIETILILGTISGGTLALLALGFTLIYGVADVVNMAHGALFMLGAYMFFILGPKGLFKLELLPASILAIISVGILSIILYRLIIHPVIEDIIAVLVITVAVNLVFERIILLAPVFGIPLGTEPKHIPELVPGFTIISGVKVMNSQLLAFALSLSLFAALWIFIRTSKIGKAMRAAALDREMAMLIGINTERLYMLTMAISGSLAAVAGIFITASVTGEARSYMWLDPLFVSFAIVLLGGLGSIKGTLVGGFIVGFAENAFIAIDPKLTSLRSAVSLIIMLLVLLLRPKGLFGKRIEMEE